MPHQQPETWSAGQDASPPTGTSTRPTKGLGTGDVIASERWPTLEGTPVQVPAPAAGMLTHIQFRRFAGCPVCNLHLRTFIARRTDLDAAGVLEVVVFHSSAEELRRYEADLPFAVVPDPGKRLYRRFAVEESRRALLSPRVWVHIIQAVLRSSWLLLTRGGNIPPLQPPGGRYGLPADLLVRPDGHVVAAHYGTHAYDQWTIEVVLELAAQDRDPSTGGNR